MDPPKGLKMILISVAPVGSIPGVFHTTDFWADFAQKTVRHVQDMMIKPLSPWKPVTHPFFSPHPGYRSIGP
jgi:hypothetical protein